MFDANAAHIQVGQKFFAEVHATDEVLDKLGVKAGSIVLVEHEKKEGHKLRHNVGSWLWLSRDAEPVYYNPKDAEEFGWLVYSGRPNGNGFINDKWKAKALEFIGEWAK